MSTVTSIAIYIVYLVEVENLPDHLSVPLSGESDDEWPVDNPPAIGAGAKPDVPGLDHVQPKPSIHISIASPPAPPPAAITPRPQPSPIAAAVTTCQRSDAPGKDKNRKKSKNKSQPKTRTIKFHEYKVSSLSIYCVNISAARTTVSFCVTCTNESNTRRRSRVSFLFFFLSPKELRNDTVRSRLEIYRFYYAERIMSSE